MSDGIEERQERELRREQQQKEDRGDWACPDEVDDRQPERVDS